MCTTTVVQSVGGESFWTDLELSVYINYDISPPATTSPSLPVPQLQLILLFIYCMDLQTLNDLEHLYFVWHIYM